MRLAAVYQFDISMHHQRILIYTNPDEESGCQPTTSAATKTLLLKIYIYLIVAVVKLSQQ